MCWIDFRAPGGLHHSNRGQPVWRDTPPHQWAGLLPGQHQWGQPGPAGVGIHLLRLSGQQGRHHRGQSHVLHSVSCLIDFRFWNSNNAHCLPLSIWMTWFYCPIYMVYDIIRFNIAKNPVTVYCNLNKQYSFHVKHIKFLFDIP